MNRLLREIDLHCVRLYWKQLKSYLVLLFIIFYIFILESLLRLELVRLSIYCFSTERTFKHSTINDTR